MTKLRLALGLLLALMWALGLGAVAWAQDVLPVPPLTGRVIDQTATLQPAQAAALDAKLAAFEAASGPQIVLLMVPSTAPEDISAFAQRVAESWKINDKDIKSTAHARIHARGGQTGLVRKKNGGGKSKAGGG